MLKVGQNVRVKGTQSPTNPNKLARGKILSCGEFKGEPAYDVMVRLRAGPMRMSFLREADLVTD